MRPTPVQPALNLRRRRRRRLDLTLPIPQRDPCLTVPLPLPPPKAAPCATPQHHQQMPNLSELERVRRIGSGSGGTVYMVRHRRTGKIYALKVFYGYHEDAVRRQICREIEILRTVDNPYVVRCHGMFDNAGEIQILLEYMERGSLDSHGPMPEPFLAEVARQILNGIAYLHRRKIVHRDIKPSNLLINDRNQVKIADFGVSRILAQTMDPCNSSAGTISYMSPERINTDLNHGAYDGYAGDIWSLGVSILECYLGRFPFAVAKQGDWASLMVAICYSQPPEAPATASPEFRHFVECCLQKDPRRRPTAAHLLKHPFVLQTTAGNQEEDDGVDMENQMENQLSLNITSHRAQLLLDKLNGLSLPFTGRINVAEMRESLMKIQEAFTGEDDSKLGDGSAISGAEKLKEAVYEVEDVLDEYCTESLETQIAQPPSNTEPWISDKSAFFDVHLKNKQPFTGSISSGSAYSRLEFIAETLGSLIRDMVMGLTVVEKAGRSEEEESWIIHSFLEKIELTEQICGREAEKEEIVQLLINKNGRDLPFIPIVGGEGIGKTTLARLAFNDERVQTHFELKLWIQVSDSFDLLTLIREVVKAVTGSNRGDILDRGELQRLVHGALGGTLFLLVLDDVRDVSMIDGLINFLSCVGSGSRILITTTLLHFDSSESNTRPFNLKGLSDEDCWSLFSQRAFDNPIQESDPKLVTIGRDIVKMCKGVPLFVKMFSGLLYFQREESEWELVREGVMRKYGHDFHLRLCYSHLKPHLKQCFAFCSLFPKGCEIDKETLIQLWMANDLVTSRDGMELEDVGHEIFSELVVRSFFQEIQHRFANVTTFKVHNLLHGLARRAMGYESAYAQECHLMNLSKFRHLSLPSSSLEFPVILSQARKLRTFILLPLHLEFRHFCSEVSSLHGTIIRFPVLRVLDLRGWKENPLPMEIISLKFLRYLDLSYASVVNLPAAVSTLINLQTLKLRECRSLCQLPEGTKNMINLRYLDIRGCNLLTHIPPKIGLLRCLQVLSLFIVGNKTSECSDMEELQHLKLRESLQIKHLERVTHPADAQRANLLGKPNLGELHLCWRAYNEGEEEINDDKDTFGVNTETEVLEGLQPHQNLEKLWITDYMGIHFPGWLMGSQLQNLVEIRLYRCRRCEYLPPFGQLPSLKVLCIENLDAVEYIGNEFYGNGLSEGFPSLETLKIRYMLNLEAWLELQGREAFLRLSKLEVAFCKKLTTMPCFPSIKDLFLDEIDSMLLSSVADCTSLESLTIHSISGLMSLPEGLLQNLTSLRSLKISRCENLARLPAQLQNLTSLELFSLSHCAGLVSLPNEGIQGLASLKELKIEHCKNLTDLSKGLQHLTTLRMLHVNWCDKLEYMQGGLQYLTHLKHLSLFYCEGLKTLPEGIGNLSSLEVLTFGSPKLTALPDAIRNLSSLQVLMIRSLSLTSLPKGLQQLTTLRELFIGSCPQLVSLPEWLENLKSLESLYIMSCPNMTSLPAGLQHLTSLRRLLIHECPNLNIRCKSTGEDWHKIQHIPSFVIQ